MENIGMTHKLSCADPSRAFLHYSCRPFRGSNRLTKSLTSLIQFSSPSRKHLGLQDEEERSNSQIGLEATLASFCPQTTQLPEASSSREMTRPEGLFGLSLKQYGELGRGFWSPHL
jgi:hypothetical protein